MLNIARNIARRSQRLSSATQLKVHDSTTMCLPANMRFDWIDNRL